jgi:hypothetical protein
MKNSKVWTEKWNGKEKYNKKDKTIEGADPVAARSEAWVLSARGFESRLRHRCLSTSVCVVLSCVGRGLSTS